VRRGNKNDFAELGPQFRAVQHECGADHQPAHAVTNQVNALTVVGMNFTDQIAKASRGRFERLAPIVRELDTSAELTRLRYGRTHGRISNVDSARLDFSVRVKIVKSAGRKRKRIQFVARPEHIHPPDASVARGLQHAAHHAGNHDEVPFSARQMTRAIATTRAGSRR
jgi:hypothetical protein